MIDLHSHILAGVDDGARSLDDSLLLIEGAVNSGVRKILATPHIHIGTFDNNLTTINPAFHQLTSLISQSSLAQQVSIAYAAEVRICPEIMMWAKNDQLPFMGKWQGANLLLLEFPHSHIPPGSEKLVDWLLANNIMPMIAHPERNRGVWESPDILSAFKARGCLFQVTAASLLGDFGERSKNIAWDMLRKEEVSVVASDMHNIKRRPSKMKEAFLQVSEQLDLGAAEKIFSDTPGLIFESNPTIWTNQ